MGIGYVTGVGHPGGVLECWVVDYGRLLGDSVHEPPVLFFQLANLGF